MPANGERHPALEMLGGIASALDRVKEFVSYVFLFGIAVAFLVMGHLAGRLVGVALFAIWLAITVRVLRRHL